jgi:DeoR/GlpR family transcriptional regulator of sugar metabolism
MGSIHGRDGSYSQLQRHEWIAESIQRSDFLSAKELAERFEVSLMTIHRDLDELEHRGLLRRVHGGATRLPFSLFAGSVRSRLTTAAEAKEALARFALGLVEPGQAVLLDESTTALALARHLPSVAPLTVITNFHPILHELSLVRDVSVILLGGRYDPQRDAFFGIVCEAATAALRADVVFMSVAAVSTGFAYQGDEHTAFVKRAMLTAAARRVLLIDHSKLGRTALHRLAPLDAFDLVVVDAGASDAELSQLRETGVRIEVAPPA